MDESPDEWMAAKAVKPFLLTFSFIFASLVHLSFPNQFRKAEAVAIVGALSGTAWFNSEEMFPDSYVERIYLRTVIIFVSYFLYLVIRENKSDKKYPNIQDALISPPKNPWVRGYKLLFNGRGIDADWELPYLWSSIPESKILRESSHKTARASNKAKLQSRRRWVAIAVRVGYLLLNFTIYCVYYEAVDPARWIRLRPSDTTKEKESIFRRTFQMYAGSTTVTPITSRDLAVRAWAVSAVLVHDYLVLSMYHDLCAIIFIGSGLDEDWEWPPLFGSITEVYNMRRYWSIFWHRLIYKSFNAHAGTILSLFGMQEKTLAYRLLRNELVFFLSALQHWAVSWRIGNPCAGGDFKYWMLQPLAFVIEGYIEHLWGQVRPFLLRHIHPVLLKIVERVVGYVWVIAWLLWWAPKGKFPLVFCGQK